MDTRSQPIRIIEVTHRSVLAIAVPMTLGYVTTPLLGLTDTAVIGRTGEAAALAGLAIAAALFDLLFGSLNFLRASTTALVAQAQGRGDGDELFAVFWRSMALSVGFGLLILALSPLIISGGLAMMGAEGRVATAAATYIAIRIIAAPLTLSNFTLLGFVLGRGLGSVGLGLQILLNGINIVMSILLGLTFGWGIAGVAWGTVIGETVAALAGLAFVFRCYGPAAMPRLAMLTDTAKLRELFHLNRDILIRTFSLITAFTVMTRVGASFGPVTLAANAVLLNFFMISSFYLDGIATAAEQIAGQTIGARYRPGFERAVKLTGIWSLGLALASLAFFLGLGESIIGFITTAQEVRIVADLYLPYAALTALTGALAFQMDGIFIGATWSREMRNMMIVALTGYLATLAALVPSFGNHGLWIALNVFLALRGLLLLSRLKPKLDQTFAASQ
ncbi:MAG: MATE family efflux transporter [Alphaproteobacteria bacterium]|nr:MATE family efflux transporter [Rhizobiaceae bacterium]MBC7149116.1 MATE family efflux transporter [Rhizobium sp.]MBU3964046.1 MATE family efflux transporter [Alphaproteobacteria bacterium]MBU4048242.1 MATE family efflux transporter [Alphaproteobacteria bacterium]MBU4089213.1 MATE family efflux transporter [Alphaproteobacteria bacterium]